MIKSLTTTKKNYPNITTVIFYLSKKWGEAKNKAHGSKSKAQQAVEDKAYSLGIKIIWRTPAFFESEFVVSKNNDLARHFFTADDYHGWERFRDWSSTQANIDSEYLIDKDIKIITPNHKPDENSDVISGINEIRSKLNQVKSSVRLVGLSGVGKTRLAQALFDERIGEDALSVRQVWYCDAGTSPNPIPLHFINELKLKNERYVVIVDNCGQQLHGELTKAIANDDNLLSLLTIEYDISDDLPESTDVFKLEPNSKNIIEKVINRHYPNVSSAHTIAELTGGNYRLALAIASNIDRTDNIAVLNDNELFKRLFYQNGSINDEHYKIAQVCSMVYSFNLKDTTKPDSEIDFLAKLAEVTPRKLKKAINSLKNKDIVQQRGDFRAILPHVLANHLFKKYLNQLDSDILLEDFLNMSSRMKLSVIKRLTYFSANKVIQTFVSNLLTNNGFYENKILIETLELDIGELRAIELLAQIDPIKITTILFNLNQKNPNFFSRDSPYVRQWINILRVISNHEKSFVVGFSILLKLIEVRNKEPYPFNRNRYSGVSYMFKIDNHDSLVKLDTKIELLNKLYDENKFELVLGIIKDSLNIRTPYRRPLDLSRNISVKLEQSKHTKTEIKNYIINLYDLLLRINKTQQNNEAVKETFQHTFIEVIQITKDVSIVNNYMSYLKLQGEQGFSIQRLNSFISKNKKYLEDKEPEILQDLVNLLNDNYFSFDDVHYLINDYLLSGGLLLSNKIESLKYSNKFSNYQEVIDFIAEKIVEDVSILDKYLVSFLSFKNTALSQLSKQLININFDAGIIFTRLSTSTNKVLDNRPHFLEPFLKVVSLEDRKQSITEIAKLNAFSVQTVCLVNDFIVDFPKETDFYVQLFLNNKLDYRYLTDLNYKVKDEFITKNDYDKIIEGFMKNECFDIPLLFLCRDAFLNNKINCNFIDFYSDNLKEILSRADIENIEKEIIIKSLIDISHDEKNKVFIEIRTMMNQADYFFLNTNCIFSDFISLLLNHDAQLFFDIFIKEESFFEKLKYRGIWHFMNEVGNDVLIDWITDDFDKAKLFLSEAKFFNNTNSFRIDLIATLLNTFYDKKEKLLETLFNEQIFNVTSWDGSLVQAMKRRLSLSETFKSYLKERNIIELIPFIEKKEIKYKEEIEKEKQREHEENKVYQRFEY